MGIMPVSKNIRALLGFSRLSDSDLLFRGRHVYESMLLNPHFPRPPVSLDDFKTVLDRFREVTGESVHGDRRMFAEKANLREEIIGMMRQLGHYVEAACENDMATFVASGFEAGPTAHVPPVPLPQPSIQKIEQGLSGQLLVRISSLGRKAKSYNLRYAALDGDGTPPVGPSSR